MIRSGSCGCDAAGFFLLLRHVYLCDGIAPCAAAPQGVFVCAFPSQLRCFVVFLLCESVDVRLKFYVRPSLAQFPTAQTLTPTRGISERYVYCNGGRWKRPKLARSTCACAGNQGELCGTPAPGKRMRRIQSKCI